MIEQAKGFENPHRELKCILLKNEFLKILEPSLTEKDCEAYKDELTGLFGSNESVREKICSDFDANTLVADRIFGRAIYADEMVEIYLNQEATQFFRIIKEISGQ